MVGLLMPRRAAEREGWQDQETDDRKFKGESVQVPMRPFTGRHRRLCVSNHPVSAYASTR